MGKDKHKSKSKKSGKSKRKHKKVSFFLILLNFFQKVEVFFIYCKNILVPARDAGGGARMSHGA